MATIIIDTDRPEGKAFLNYAKKLDFVQVQRTPTSRKKRKSTVENFPAANLPSMRREELTRRIQKSLDGENATEEELQDFLTRWQNEK